MAAASIKRREATEAPQTGWSCRLAVELDGAPHFSPNVDLYDTDRTNYLERQGIKVIRFENRTVHHDIELVLEIIRENLRQMSKQKPEGHVQ